MTDQSGMMRETQAMVIRGPLAPHAVCTQWRHPILYAVHLQDGWIATHPEAYPASSEDDDPSHGGGT